MKLIVLNIAPTITAQAISPTVTHPLRNETWLLLHILENTRDVIGGDNVEQIARDVVVSHKIVVVKGLLQILRVE